jgi:hypothetical protein
MATQSTTFRCPDELMEQIDEVGRKWYPADTKTGYDRTKTIIELIKAGITAIADVDKNPSNYNVLQSLGIEETIEALLDKKLAERLEKRTA